MAGYRINSDRITRNNLTKQRVALPNNVRGNAIAAQSKQCCLAIPANVIPFTPVALLKVNSPAPQNSVNFCQKTVEKLPKDQKYFRCLLGQQTPGTVLLSIFEPFV